MSLFLHHPDRGYEIALYLHDLMNVCHCSFTLFALSCKYCITFSFYGTRTLLSIELALRVGDKVSTRSE